MTGELRSSWECGTLPDKHGGESHLKLNFSEYLFPWAAYGKTAVISVSIKLEGMNKNIIRIRWSTGARVPHASQSTLPCHTRLACSYPAAFPALLCLLARDLLCMAASQSSLYRFTLYRLASQHSLYYCTAVHLYSLSSQL